MPLYLNDEQTQLRDSVRAFLAAEAPVAQLRALRDHADADGFSRALWARFAEMGYTGILVPEALGGLGLGHVEAGQVMEAIGHSLVATPFLASAVVAVSLLRAAGSAEQQQRWLPALADGSAIATLAIDEGAKHRPLATALKAVPDGDGWRLDGDKTFVVDGHVADLLLVVARSGGAPGDAVGLSLFAVDRGTPGLAVERTTMADAHNSARLALRGVRVGADRLLGVPGQARPAITAALDAGRCAAAAEALGVADEVFERTVQYLKDRRQFGKAIGEFQALQHRAAQLFCELELNRAALIRAQQALDTGDAKATDAVLAAKATEAVAVAKARAGTGTTLAVQEAVQMHGGMGMTDAFDIGLFMKRARVLDELFGDTSFQLDRLALGRGY